ncbi:uncharacterized membrane protein YkvA (DUF1232 family) [Lipingzhangella halophila]|uniref:Uncharacterized membrane protein YkvA (DUF1232 family) n=1 Tax=Lipingzhangella halophila TaxID=1783352 RepID=A0A7W7W2U3_9ACTN|nr:DUF1232 domain-containing protein [Lipingzhangella halophila]MBB4932337.1 uncharacterized membrane protein YkvA (DUF1232 family) [Lipingzhangella halophila]
MTGIAWADTLIGLAAGLLVAWLALVGVLLVLSRRERMPREAFRLLKDAPRLFWRLAADPGLPRGVRLRLTLLTVYLVSPIDLVPDFVPVLGYADDAIIVVVVLRSVVRRAGIQAVRRHWPGTDDGFTALCRITGLPTEEPPAADAPER